MGAMSESWFYQRDALVQSHECSYYGWDGPCLRPCRDDDRYVSDDGRSVFLCANHRRLRRLPTKMYVNRTEPLVVTWAGDEP